MSKNRTAWLVGNAAAMLLAIPALSQAASTTLRRDTVLPVTFEDSLTIKENRAGDRFTVRVDDNRDLPFGTKLNGRIVNVRPARDDRPAYMDLEFTEVVLPDGTRRNFRAVPIPLNDRYTTRDADGRVVVRKDVRKKENLVLGGALGGLVLGSILKKPVEGAVLGTIAGIVLAETDKKNDGNTLIQKGQRMGALVEETVTLTYDDRGRNRDRDWDRDRDIDRNRDRNRDRDWDIDRDRNRDRDRDRDWDRGRNQDRDRDDWGRDDRNDQLGRDLRIEIGRRELRYTRREQPYRLGETVMVPLDRTAEQIGLNVEKGRNGKAIYVEGEDESTLRIQIDAREARLNGRTVTMDRAVVERDGIVYVPVELLARMKNETLRVNGNTVRARSY